jgi:hypothetical protein
VFGAEGAPMPSRGGAGAEPASALEHEAQRWVEKVHPHAAHLVRSRDWVVALDPDAGEALRIAALLHDIERAFPDPDSPWSGARDWDNPDYLRWHQDRCAAMADEWLAEHGAPVALRDDVRGLIAVHEDGGWPDADVLQAADSLSFLETLTPLTMAWVREGVPLERAVGKLRHSEERIQVRAARPVARRLVDRALSDLRASAEASPGR